MEIKQCFAEDGSVDLLLNYIEKVYLLPDKDSYVFCLAFTYILYETVCN